MELIETEGEKRALDLGAGRGRNTIFLAKNGFLVDAVDKDENSLEELMSMARENQVENSIKTHLVDLLDFETKTKYHLCVVTNVLHLLDFGVAASLLMELQRHLASGGVVVISLIVTDGRIQPEDIPMMMPGMELIEKERKIVYDAPHPGMPRPHTHDIAYFIFKNPR